MAGSNQDVGKYHEKIVGDTLKYWLEPKGYTIASHHRVNGNSLRIHPIFTTCLVPDWIIRGIPNHEEGVFISVKAQNETGQVVKVLYYEIIYAIKKALPYPSILYMVGNHYNDKMKSWAKSEIDNKWLLDVFFSSNDLSRWAQNLPDIKKKGNFHEYMELPLFKVCPRCKQTYSDDRCQNCHEVLK